MCEQARRLPRLLVIYIVGTNIVKHCHFEKVLGENQDIPLVEFPPRAISGDVMVHRWVPITLLTRNLHKNILTDNFDII